MMIYSTFIQLSKRIFCPICIFTIFVLLIQFISIYFLFNSVDYFSIFDLLCVLATLLFFLILITEQKITNKFKRGYFEANFDFKELLQNNLKPIVSNLKDGSNMIGELLKFGIHSGQTERKEKLILCMNIRCNSCIKLITELKVLSYSHYDIRVLFHITEKEGEISKNHDFKSNILLALILEKHGFLRFSEILNESIQRDLDYKYIKKKSLEKNVVLSQNSLDNMGQKIIKQNKILNKFNIKEIPFIILNNKVIPPYFKSIHYDLLR